MMLSARNLLVLLSLTTLIYSYERVPKQYSLEFGGVYNHKNMATNLESKGITTLFDYAWQLSGLDGSKPKSFITVPMGYTYFLNEDLRILSYGWTVRHDLFKDKKFIPFMGYGLLLNQLSSELHKGSRFGHQTRFDIGCDWVIKPKVHLFSKAEWSMTRFPDITGGSDWIYRVALKLGIRLYKPARKTKEN